MENENKTSITVTKNKVGRPTIVTEQIVTNLVIAFQNGLNITFACQYAKIDRQRFYDAYNKNQEFHDRIEDAKTFFVLSAGNRVANILRKGSDRDAGPMARWAFERKMPNEWGPPKNNTNVAIMNNVKFVPYSWAKHANPTTTDDNRSK